jgi:membrane associated rhomboid family serine protease
MLLIPFDRAIDWSRPPLMTISLVLINVLLFFTWQSGEDQALLDAVSYYQKSGLAKTEIAAFQDWQRAHGETPSDSDGFWAIQTNKDFHRRIDAGLVMPRDSPEFADWQQRRQRFDAMLDKVTFLEYGFKTGNPELSSLFAHMFLHADLGHLLGNMFFLFAVGFLVEATIGSWLFLGCYLLGGLGSVGLEMLLSPDRMVPGIGASGAIAGLMGMYAVLFWTRKVRFFFFLLVYFDYVKLPAIALLPLWIGNELYQLWQNGDSGVNYLAHLGGLCSGALLALAVRRWAPSFSLEAFEAVDREQAREQLLQQARSLCRKLDYNKALPLLRRLYAEAPEQRETLYLYQQALRLDPSTDEYHRINRAILALPASDAPSRELLLEVLTDYVEHARPAPRLNQQLACRLAPLLIDAGKLDAGQRLFRTLLKHRWPCADARATVARLADQLQQAQQPDEAARYRQLLATLSD